MWAWVHLTSIMWMSVGGHSVHLSQNLPVTRKQLPFYTFGALIMLIVDVKFILGVIQQEAQGLDALLELKTQCTRML